MHRAPITETPNELTWEIDVASPKRIVRMLRAVDAQIYNGYGGYPGVCDEQTVARIVQIIEWATPLVGQRDARIILSGAGTSGRLAMFLARTFNRFLTSKKRAANVHYLIAGGNLALIKAQEGAEDDPHQACADLKPVIDGAKRILFIGITCGLSAPYIAGQLSQLSRRKDARYVLLGFNPEQDARTVAIENWDRTFADVVRSIKRRKNCLILNPVVGPEAITGSTRLKGGSATKMLIEIILGLACDNSGISAHRGAEAAVSKAVRACLRAYEQTRVAVYERNAEIASLVAMGGRSLRQGGHIYYAGSGSPGILGIVDASECPPTFGARFEDVRGFVTGGWRTLLGPGHDLSEAGSAYRISMDEFVRHTAASLGKRDLVVGLPSGPTNPAIEKALQLARKAGAATAIIRAGKSSPVGIKADVVINMTGLPRSPLPLPQVLPEYATKLTLNALTTGAHVLSGKVYQNRMVDLRISNTKLYHRTIGIIRDIAGVSAPAARRALLRSIHEVDRIGSALASAKPSRHVEASTDVWKVVPKALIMAARHVTCADAENLLRNEPIVRAAIDKLKTIP